VQQEACPGEQLQFTTCSQYVGDTFIRLFLDGLQVAFNDDLNALCSGIDYTYTSASCGELDLHLGCFADNACQMTATVEINCEDSQINSFPYTTCNLVDTNNALQNTVAVQQEACPGEQLQFTTCSQYVGDTFIRLFLDGLQVAANDDVSLGNICSVINYSYTGTVCADLELHLGCFATNNCQMTGTVDITPAIPTAEPTVEPTAEPTP